MAFSVTLMQLNPPPATRLKSSPGRPLVFGFTEATSKCSCCAPQTEAAIIAATTNEHALIDSLLEHYMPGHVSLIARPVCGHGQQKKPPWGAIRMFTFGVADGCPSIVSM